MNGGQALIHSLHRQGVRVVFGLPGAGQYEAVDALYDFPDIQYISTRHEQAVSYMADGYARVTGKPGVGIVVEGPGFFNTTAGLATAFAASSPVLIITGNCHHSSDTGLAGFDGLACHRQYAKWAGRANTPAEIPGIVNEAFRQLQTGRRRPVIVEIAPRTFAAQEDVTLLEAETFPPTGGDPDALAQAALLLANAKRPLIWVGGGANVSGAAEPVRLLAEHLKATVVSSRSGKGVLSDRHPLSLGMANLAFAPLKTWIDNRDVILAVGLGDGFSARPDHQEVIRIDIDPGEISRSARSDVSVVGDARSCMETLLRLLTADTPPRPNYPEQVHQINQERFGTEEQLQPQADFMRAIRAAIPDDGILIPGMNQMGYYSRNYYPVFSPRAYLTATSHITLGFAYPVALGAKLGQPDKVVVSVSGDGGFLYNAQELATAMQYSVNVVAVVFNDNAYGNVLRSQLNQFGGRVIGTRLRNPSFAQLGEAFGARSFLAQTAEQLETALREAIAAGTPALIEVPVGAMERKY